MIEYLTLYNHLFVIAAFDAIFWAGTVALFGIEHWGELTGRYGTPQGLQDSAQKLITALFLGWAAFPGFLVILLFIMGAAVFGIPFIIGSATWHAFPTKRSVIKTESKKKETGQLSHPADDGRLSILEEP